MRESRKREVNRAPVWVIFLALKKKKNHHPGGFRWVAGPICIVCPSFISFFATCSLSLSAFVTQHLSSDGGSRDLRVSSYTVISIWMFIWVRTASKNRVHVKISSNAHAASSRIYPCKSHAALHPVPGYISSGRLPYHTRNRASPIFICLSLLQTSPDT